MKKFLIIIFLFALVNFNCSKKNDWVAKVNGEVITFDELKYHVNYLTPHISFENMDIEQRRIGISILPLL